MKGKSFLIPLRYSSSLGPALCPDGEVEGMFYDDGAETAPDAGSPSQPEVETGVTTGGSALPREMTAAAPHVEFALKRTLLPGWHTHLSLLPGREMPRKEATDAGWGAQASEVVRMFGEDASANGLFVNPFFVMTALRMADGSRILPSPPVLMIPNSDFPAVAGQQQFDVETMKMSVIAAVCSLQWRVWLPQGFAEAMASAGRVTHLDVLVSDPLVAWSKDVVMRGTHRAVSPTFCHAMDADGVCAERPVDSTSHAQLWVRRGGAPALGRQSLCTPDKFKRVASVTLKRLQAIAGTLPCQESDWTGAAFADVPLEEEVLTDLDKADGMRPDYAQWQEVSARSQYDDGVRKTLCGLTLSVPSAPAFGAVAPWCSGTGLRGRSAVEVEAVKEGRVLRASRLDSGLPGIEVSSLSMPRWLFYPDPDARSLRVMTERGSLTVPLTRHPTLHGSYWCRHTDGPAVESALKLSQSARDMDERDTWEAPDAVWRSGLHNPSLWPDRLQMRAGCGRVIAVCRAFRASGLVATTAATFYLFSDRGVYLYRESSDGTLQDVGLMGRYVLRDAGSLRVSGQQLLFVCDNGAEMVIKGTKITEAADGSVSTSGTPLYRPLVICGSAADSDKIAIRLRPLKLGSAALPKRVTGVTAVGSFDPLLLTLTVEGSDDLSHWTVLAKGPAGKMCGLLLPAARYLRVSVSGTLTPGATLEAITLGTRYE